MKDTKDIKTIDIIEDCKYGYSNENSGVYMLTHKMTKRHYIGETNRLNKRFGEHCCNLRNNNHSNKALQEDFNRFGKNEELLKYEILVKCPSFLTKKLESIYISMFDKEFLYNNCKIYYNYFQNLDENQKWMTSLPYRQRTILDEYFKWNYIYYNDDTEQKRLCTTLLKEGIKEAETGKILDDCKYLKNNFHKSDNLYNNTLDYIALAIISRLNKYENNKIIFNNLSLYPEDGLLYKRSLLYNTIEKLKNNKLEAIELMKISYEFGFNHRDKIEYYDNPLDMINLLDSYVRPENLLDCLYMYEVVLFLIKSMY